MRDHAKIVSAFWTGRTGKAIRRIDNKTLRLAVWAVKAYLITNRHANMLGLYEIPLVYIAHEIGIDVDLVAAAVRELEGLEFCRYDAETEFVWIREFVRFQVFGKDEEQLKEADNRVKAVRNIYEALPANPFLGPFFDMYSNAIHLDEKRGTGQQMLPLPEPLPKVNRSPSEGASEDTTQGNTETPSKPRAGAGAGVRAGEGTGTESAEPQSDSAPAVLSVPLVHKLPTGEPEMFNVTDEQVARWRETYPAVDILFELRKLREWNHANPSRRKTKRGIVPHIVRWLASAQDKGGTRGYRPDGDGNGKPGGKDGDVEKAGAIRADLAYWGVTLVREEREPLEHYRKRALDEIAKHIAAGGKPAHLTTKPKGENA